MRKTTWLPAFAVLAAFGGGTARTAEPVVTYASVPDQYATIGDALWAVRWHETVVIHVAPGTYEETLMIRQANDLTLEGAGARIVGIRDDDAALTICTSEKVTVQGITFSGPGAGISVVAVDSVVLRDVVVSGTGGAGVTVEARRIIPGPPGLGDPTLVNPVPTHVQIEDSRIEDTVGPGIAKDDWCSAAVERTTISGTGDDGVHARGDGLLLRDSTITGTAGDGVYVTDGSASVVDCSIEHTEDSGVFVDWGGSCTLDRTVVRYARGHGIAAGNSGRIHRISGCQVHAAMGDGIRGGVRLVESSVVTSSGGAGMRIHGREDLPPVDLHDNVVTGALDEGIGLYDTYGASVTSNLVQDIAGCGFRLGSGVKSSVLKKNRAEKCDGAGLDVDRHARHNRIGKSNHFGRRRSRRGRN